MVATPCFLNLSSLPISGLRRISSTIVLNQLYDAALLTKWYTRSLDTDTNTPDSWECKDSKYTYPAVGHVITGNLKIVSDSRIRLIIWKGPKYILPSRIDFKKCREEIAPALNDFGNRWCKRESVEPTALKEWKLSIFKIGDKRIEFYSQNTILLPPILKSSFRHLKQGIEEFHTKYVLVPADKFATSLSTNDFSTLYTTLPHNLIKEKHIGLIEKTFQS